MAEVVSYLHKSSCIACVINGGTLGIAAILKDAWTISGLDVDAGFHIVVLDPVLGISQDAAQLVQRDLQAILGVSHDITPSPSLHAIQDQSPSQHRAATRHSATSSSSGLALSTKSAI